MLDGIAATRAIRAREQSNREYGYLPILGVTGMYLSELHHVSNADSSSAANARQEQLDNAISAGMDEVITKPFHMQTDLLPAIERVKR